MVLLESKEDMRKRGVRSPDEWDAVALTFAEPVNDATGACGATAAPSSASGQAPTARRSSRNCFEPQSPPLPPTLSSGDGLMPGMVPPLSVTQSLRRQLTASRFGAYRGVMAAPPTVTSFNGTTSSITSAQNVSPGSTSVRRTGANIVNGGFEYYNNDPSRVLVLDFWSDSTLFELVLSRFNANVDVRVDVGDGLGLKLAQSSAFNHPGQETPLRYSDDELLVTFIDIENVVSSVNKAINTARSAGQVPRLRISSIGFGEGLSTSTQPGDAIAL
jgi:hypothetical protein